MICLLERNVRKVNTRPFVLFGTARTGSTLLKSLLNAHPAIHCDGELFNPTFWSRPTRSQRLYKLWRVNPLPYIATRKFYIKLRTRRPVYGFKLFERHVAEPERLLLALQDKGWRIIYIRRRSVFARSLSAMVGKTTAHWISIGQSRGETLSVTIDPDEFMQIASFVYDQEIRCEAIMQAIPHLGIIYENHLQENLVWQSTLDQICDFLEIGRICADSPVHRTWRQPYREFVSNYAELVDVFHRSPLADQVIST